MRTTQDAVHSDLATSASAHNFVNDLCLQLAASRDDLVLFGKYAAAPFGSAGVPPASS